MTPEPVTIRQLAEYLAWKREVNPACGDFGVYVQLCGERHPVVPLLDVLGRDGALVLHIDPEDEPPSGGAP